VSVSDRVIGADVIFGVITSEKINELLMLGLPLVVYVVAIEKRFEAAPTDEAGEDGLLFGYRKCSTVFRDRLDRANGRDVITKTLFKTPVSKVFPVVNVVCGK
jgi:hypothetical protein